MADQRSWRLGEILVQKGWITWDQLQEALKLQRESEASEKFSEIMITRHPKVSKNTPILNLGEVLIQHGWIGWDQLSEALAVQKATGKILGKILLEKRFLSEKDLQRALAIQYNMTFVDFDKINIQAEIVELVPKSLAYEHRMFPLVKKGSSLLVAVADPHNTNPQLALKKVLPTLEILTALATAGDILKALQKYYGLE